MRLDDAKFLNHPLVRQIYELNETFYLAVARENYPIRRLIGRPNRKKEDVVKALAFGILGDFWVVVQLLNENHPDWRKAF